MPRRPHMSKYISEAARRAGISVAEACTQAGIHRAEAHHGSMSADKARRLAEVLDLEPGELLAAYRADEVARAHERVERWWTR